MEVEFKMLFLLQCLLLLQAVFGGTHCPPRDEIRPCICLNRPLPRKKVETTLICHNLADDKSIEAIHPALIHMEIEKFYLYDSFWKMEPKKANDPATAVNIFTTYRITEINMVDTAMMHFGCPMVETCGTNYVKSLTSINITLNERQSCNNNGLAVNTWIMCPNSIEYLKINNGLPVDYTLRSEFFPLSMEKLKELDLSNNKIAKIDRRTFNNIRFPELQKLNLSYNRLRDLRQVFSTPMEIKHLDLSNNHFRGVQELTNLLKLETLILASNQITSLLENEWTTVPQNLRHLDFSGNAIKCDCSGFKWVNSTFHINTNLIGKCSSPNEVQGMKLRKASRALIERCNEQGVIGSRITVRRE